MAKAPVVLIIRDGWGVNPGGKETAEADGNAVELAKTPFHDGMLGKYPKGFVSCSGMDVGLPDGQMGNSEVGHNILGAGRISERVVAHDDAIATHRMLPLSLTFDHRAVTGMEAAAFLRAVMDDLARPE